MTQRFLAGVGRSVHHLVRNKFDALNIDIDQELKQLLQGHLSPGVLVLKAV
jgi:hypothetical protein